MIRSVLSRVTLCIIALSASLTAVAESKEPVNYMPEFHGTFRGRWELATVDGSSRFQVRNARLTIEGKVAPIVSYLFQSDLSDRGEMKILDAYATIAPWKTFEIQVGQYRMPFGKDSFRGPSSYYFNNRSFIGKRINNVRAVGVSLAYTIPGVPLTFDGGIFNPTSITDHEEWITKYALAGKAVYAPGDFEFTAGVESIRPEHVRINLFGFAAGWRYDRFYAETEYICRTYANDSHPTTHSINVFADYGIPLHNTLFDTWSFQARFDAMTDLASGWGVVNGVLPTTEPARQRVTLGTTLDYKFKDIRTAVRLNYEFIFHKAVLPPGDDDKLSIELIVSF